MLRNQGKDKMSVQQRAASKGTRTNKEQNVLKEGRTFGLFSFKPLGRGGVLPILRWKNSADVQEEATWHVSIKHQVN